MFEQAFKSIDDILWKEAGCTTELDYTEQSSWLLFLKYLDALEQDRASEAELEGKRYEFIIDKAYRWETWAAPKDRAGKLDHNKAKTGPDLIDFVNGKLFPYLQSFKAKASGSNTIEYKVGEIFAEIKNKIASGYNLREIIDVIDTLRFRSQAEKHELSPVSYTHLEVPRRSVTHGETEAFSEGTWPVERSPKVPVSASRFPGATAGAGSAHGSTKPPHAPTSALLLGGAPGSAVMMESA